MLLLLPAKFPAIELWIAAALETSLTNILLAGIDPYIEKHLSAILYIVAIFPCSPTAGDILVSSKFDALGQEG